MYYTVVDARYVRDFTIWAKFADGSEGDTSRSFASSSCGDGKLLKQKLADGKR
jgi:hypothetical protein